MGKRASKGNNLKSKQNEKTTNINTTQGKLKKFVRKKDGETIVKIIANGYNLRNRQTCDSSVETNDEGKTVFPNPLVLICKCLETENLISKLSEQSVLIENLRDKDIRNQVEGAAAVTPAANLTLEPTASTSNDSNMESLIENKPSVNISDCSKFNKNEHSPNMGDCSKFIRSFKITASLSERTRKIDVITVPIDNTNSVSNNPRISNEATVNSSKVSTNEVPVSIENVINEVPVSSATIPVEGSVSITETPKQKLLRLKRIKRRRIWNIPDKLKPILFENMIKITSSNTIFKHARLDIAENSSSPSFSDTISTKAPIITRTIGTKITSPSKSVTKWSSRESICSENESVTSNNVTRVKIMSPQKELPASNIVKKPPSPIHYDCNTSVQIKSESSGYYSSEQKLSDSPSSSTLSSPNRIPSSDSEQFNNIDCNINRHPIHKSVHNSQNPIRKITLIPQQQIQHQQYQLQHHQQQQQQYISTNKRKCDFKTPRLPDIKRPPTRIKNDSSISSYRLKVVEPKATCVNTESDDDSDAISLYAESCLDVEEKSSNKISLKSNQNSSPNKQRIHNSPIKPHLDVKKDKTYPEITINRQLFQANKEYIVEPDEKSKENSNLLVSQNFTEPNTSKVNNWIKSTPVTQNCVNIHVVMRMLKKICHSHYRYGNCKKRRTCTYPHNLPDDFQHTLRELNETQFQMVLKELNKFRYLFKEAFDMVVLCFKEKNQVDCLIEFIEEVLKLELDKTPFIKKIILALKDMGMSFVEAIDEILLTHGRKTQSLLDILLLVIVEEGDCLENNWQLMDKLTKFRKNKLDYGVVSEIFQKCCNTDKPRKDFCENIYKDLIIKSHIELDKIDRNLVIKYVNLLYRFDFFQYAEHLKQNNGIHDYEVVTDKLNTTNNIIEDDSPPNNNNDTGDNSSYATSLNSSTSTNHTTSSPSIKTNTKSSKKSNIASLKIDDEEEVLDFSFDQPDEIPENVQEDMEDVNENDDEKMMEEIFEEYQPDQPSVESTNVPLFQIKEKNNHSYTNSELETYLDSVNRDTYNPAANYYRSDEQASVSNSVHNNGGGGSNDICEGISSSPIKHLPATPSIQPNISRSTRIPAGTSPNIEPRETDLPDVDVEELVSSIKVQNIPRFLNVMNKSSNKNSGRSFVAHTVSALKYLSTTSACKLIVEIFENLKSLLVHIIKSTSPMKDLMKSLGFNILPFLDKNKNYAAATKIINIFAPEMDSFVITRCIRNYDWLSTQKLRYIFIFKIYTRDFKFKDSLKLLKSSSLNLFHNMEEDVENIDYKKRILTEFIELSLQKDLTVARETMLYLMLNMESLHNTIDLVKYLNNLLVRLLNINFNAELLGLIDNISNGWYKYLKRSIMRALLIKLFTDLPEKKLLEFFHLCTELQIYRIHEGTENSIEIPANLLSEEIQLILHIQFYKICNCKFPLNNIIICVEGPIEDDEYTPHLTILTNSLADSKDMITRIRNVFSKFSHFPSREFLAISSGCITIPYEHLKYFFMLYSNSMPSLVRSR